jgi:hypothetical protein
MSKTESVTKKPIRKRTERLDGKPLSRPRGRNAVHGKPVMTTTTLPPRLGFRVSEFAALCGVSEPHIWRGIKAGTIETSDVNGLKIIPRTFAIKQGLIES